MSENCCINCNQPFEIKNKGFKRHSLNTSICGNEYNVEHKFQMPAFLCSICFNLLGKTVLATIHEKEFCSRTASVKRKNEQRTPVKTPRKLKRAMTDVGTSPLFSPRSNLGKHKFQNAKAHAVCAIQKSKYTTAFKYLMKSPAARRALQRLIKLEVRRECTAYGKGGCELSKTVTRESIQNFSWKNVINDLKDHLPTLYSSLVGGLTSRENEATKLKFNGSDFGKNIPGMGMAFSLLMYTRQPKKFNFIQELCALEMWSSGSNQKLFQCFQHLGISKGLKGATNAVDRLRKEFDKEIIHWKSEIQQNMGAPPERIPNVRIQLFPDTNSPENSSDSSIDSNSGNNDLEETYLYSGSDTEMMSDSQESETEKHPGFSLVWDNVQVMTSVRHQKSDKQNKMLLWALSFAVKNRNGFQFLVDRQVKKAKDMPLHLFLPTQDDYDNLRIRMEVIVMRILKRHLDVFKECEVIEHIPHQYSENSSKKSRIVNLGVFDDNPSSVAGVISILDKLHRYVPQVDDNLFTVPCHGDGLSVERMRDAKSARSASLTKDGRFEGIEPVPQEFHKRCILVQDLMDEFYCGSSGADRGSLFHIRNMFNHRNVTKSVNNSFNAIADLLQFTTEGLVTLLAMKLSNIDDLKDIPPEMDNKDDYILSLSKKCVDVVWHQVSQENIQAVLDAEDEDNTGNTYYEYCFCKDDTGDRMIKCSNYQCPQGVWFHISCVGVTDVPDGDWWCCFECENTKKSQYCICHTFLPSEEMVRCSKGTNCVGRKVYHLKCLDLLVQPGVRWMCSACKRNKNVPKEDHVFLYTCSLLYRGLQDLAYKDAVRENDGIAMTESWKIDMIQFWQKNHNKYLILGHKLLADVQGFQPSRLKNEIIWNRTANIKGGAGHNLPLDLINEFLNRDFKENLTNSRGHYSDINVARTSQFVGTIGRDLDSVFQRQVSGTWVKRQLGGSYNYDSDVNKFVDEYFHDDLFGKHPCRQHSAFPGFLSVFTIDKPEKLKGRLKKYSDKLDRARDILPH